MENPTELLHVGLRLTAAARFEEAAAALTQVAELHELVSVQMMRGTRLTAR